jgi:hypothetical protein
MVVVIWGVEVVVTDSIRWCMLGRVHSMGSIRKVNYFKSLRNSIAETRSFARAGGEGSLTALVTTHANK